MSTTVKSKSVLGMRLMNRQVACADVILLNKTDLVDEQQLHEVEDRIR
jgi:G3E family GTPase